MPLSIIHSISVTTLSMAIDSTQIEGLIDSNLPDATDRRNKPGTVRQLLKLIVRFVRDSMNAVIGSVASNFFLQVSTSPGDGLPAVRYYPILTLPTPSGSTYDYADLEILIKPWDYGQGDAPPLHIELYVSNRGGFLGQFKSIGNLQNGGAVVAYTDQANKTTLYLKLNNNFKLAGIRIPKFSQADIVASLVGVANTPSGTLVFSTEQPGTYAPVMRIDSDKLQIYNALLLTEALVRSGLKTAAPNANALAAQPISTIAAVGIEAVLGGPAFMMFHRPGESITYLGVDNDNVLKVRSSIDGSVSHRLLHAGNMVRKTGAGLNLKSNSYVEFTLEDGTVIKLAEVS